MKKMLLALLTGLAAGVAGAEDVKFLEYVEVPYGAYFDTGVVPTDHETETSYRCDIRDIYAAKEDDGYLAEPRVSTTCALELTAPNDKGNISADPLFKRKRGVPCQFGSSSPCYDTAAKLGWMDENAVDLLGNARIFSTGPDMGCFESRSGGLLLRVK